MSGSTQPKTQPVKLTAADRKYAREFQGAPYGPHSLELQRIVNILRGPPVKGKYVLVCTEPHREWVLGRLAGAMDRPIEILPDHVFTDLAAAEWFVFKLRWREHTGEELEDG